MSDSNNPKIAGKKPEALDLEKGTYYWCSCGHSKKQPFCDGAHKSLSGQSFEPKEFVIDVKQQAALCMCKHTNSPPFCDGSHSKI